ncbi:uncharacterized protein K452DRAFT_289816 [Aplosporella prunicola CBS 121167]|uniref:Pseudouridine synthase I TruA alpha/beta domain-containing protein n=1 Tax=Aplosporella prunicola CBS 121167 TaxID=1176127 RepID=A0A6A6B528_9PEZI|nr:uncharacterized protein K452DRAFT_289816 [Aplosporella prunicola CBS 121167]KAF2139269.1 hypothetical protein K452DRAFT_289816 [Aplosporella prunicola CBS 121167]
MPTPGGHDRPKFRTSSAAARSQMQRTLAGIPRLNAVPFARLGPRRRFSHRTPLARNHTAKLALKRRIEEDHYRSKALRMTDFAGLTDDEFVARRAEIEQRLARVSELEAKLALQNASATAAAVATTTTAAEPAKTGFKKQRGPPKAFDPSKYTTRLIALKFAYLGGRYNGFEHHANNTTPLPTIEEELWKALKKTRLIIPTPKPGLGEDDINWEGCDYSKCGRTDRGVSAFGQVIGIRVRSNRPKPKARPTREDVDSAEVGAVASEAAEARADGLEGEDVEMGGADAPEEVSFDDIKDEMPYVSILNRVLPEDIRVYAWCPNPGPDFSARFNCRERRYKYFFTQPAFAPMPGASGCYAGLNGKTMREGWLDIEAMREAASYLVGLNDFRNFCKVDPAKQITNFQRRITHTSIDRWNTGSGFASYTKDEMFQIPELEGSADKERIVGAPELSGPGLFTFCLHGSAFLWHQVRHIVAILFLVGQGLEPPTIVRDLLDIEKNPTKPKYEMATDTPLVLWDCIFPKEGDESKEVMEDALDWVWVGDERGLPGSKAAGLEEKFGHNSVMADLWTVWHKRRIDEALSGSLLDLVASQGLKFSEEQLKGPPSTKGQR